MKIPSYYNGTIAPFEELMIPAMDRAFYFGDGCYEAAWFGNRQIFAEQDHMERFYNSCRLMKIPFEMTPEELLAELRKVLALCDSEEGMLYWQVSRGSYYRQHGFPPAEVKPNLFIYATPGELTSFDYQYHLYSHEDDRYQLCNIKTINRVPNILAYNEAREAGCAEVVYHRGERVTEGTFSNIVMLKDGALCVPPTDNLVLPGITMKHLVKIAKANNIPVKEAPFTMDELRAADEVLIASTGVFGIAACELDGQPVGGKAPELLHMLQQGYMQYYLQDIGLA